MSANGKGAGATTHEGEETRAPQTGTPPTESDESKNGPLEAIASSLRWVRNTIQPHLPWLPVIVILITWFVTCETQQGQIDDIESGVESTNTQLQTLQTEVAKLTGLQSDIASIREDLSTLLVDVAKLQPAPAVLRETASPSTAGGEQPAQPAEAPATTPAAGDKLTGVASVIGDDRAGKPMFCDERPYDPQEHVIAVATTVQEELLPCGSLVRVYWRPAWSDDVLEEDAIVADTFADPSGFDINSDLARKFNLSRATANALGISGLDTVTVELIKKGESE